MNIYGSPSCTFTQFLQHLVFESSPAANESQLIWDIFLQYRIDPAVALGIFHHESRCGNEGKAVANKSWGNLRYVPVYGVLPYPVRDNAGFCQYPSSTQGARHFAEHLRSIDGTANYFQLTTLEQIIPIYAPSSSNKPDLYIKAVEDFVEKLSGKGKKMIRVLHVAGHVRCENITTVGLCDGLDKVASAAALRAMTGTTGEQDFTSAMAQLQTDLMNATGQIEARAQDCTYVKEAYLDWAPDLVIAHHIHRDGQNRAMFAVPDPGYNFQVEAAHQESIRLMARVIGGYTGKTGIPVMQDSVTLRMRQLYTWCYIKETTQALIPEYGNGNLDTVALFNADSARKIAMYMRDCVLEHFNLSLQPAPAPIPAPIPAPQPSPDPAVGKLAAAKQHAQQIIDL